MVLFWIQLQKLLYSDVGETERVGAVCLIICGVNLRGSVTEKRITHMQQWWLQLLCKYISSCIIKFFKLKAFSQPASERENERASLAAFRFRQITLHQSTDISEIVLTVSAAFRKKTRHANTSARKIHIYISSDCNNIELLSLVNLSLFNTLNLH